MSKKLPDHDPRALRGFALIAERQGDQDTARVLRAAAAHIEKLEQILREEAERELAPLNDW